MDNMHSPVAFSRRLHEVLEYRGHTTHAEKVRVIVEATGRTARTAKRWLDGKTTPRPFLLITIAKSLGANIDWMVLGDGADMEVMEIIENMRTMTPWEKNKYLRLGIRLLNNDAKATRLAGMFDRGEISRQQLFSMM